MRTKTRIIAPIVMALIILASCVGGWLWYDNNVDRSGWREKDGIRFYQDFHADPVSGWLELEEGRYFFNADGTPCLGWQELDGITYYFGDSGIMHTGWLEKDGKLHYFGGNGSMVTGWLWLEEGRYYLRDGALLTGWQEIEGDTYHFSPEGIATLGFAEIDGKQYYFEDGILAVGQTVIDDQHYLFLEDGVMHTGWLESEAGKRYYLPEGPMVTGWQESEAGRQYFGDDGYLRTGWQRLGEYDYYFGDDGFARTGPQDIGGNRYYFTPKGQGVVLVNGLNPVPSWYGAEFVNVTGYHDVSSVCYEALTAMLEDLTAAGITYTFNSAYRTIVEQTTILEYRTREHMAQYALEFKEARDKAYETVAVPGTSEHHLGLAVDLLGSEAVAWLTEHCWEYGFIVRYTEAKESITGIVDEPWHFRYVGKEVSMDMKDTGLCLEEYLGAEAVNFDKVKAKYGDELYQETIWQPPEPTTPPATEPPATEAPTEAAAG